MSLYDFQLALEAEADDITGETRQTQRDATTNSDNDNGEDIDNRDNIDTNTDDILGTQDDSENNDDEFMDDEDSIDDEDLGNESPEEDIEVVKKRKLKKNMILFYNIISANINILLTADSVSDNDTLNKIFINVQNSLMECKHILFEYLTTEFETASYAQSLKKYVILNKIYDICIKILEKTTQTSDLLYGANSKKNKK